MSTVLDDQRNWRGSVGVYPTDQIIIRGGIQSGNTIITYTVPANKVFNLSFFNVNSFSTSTAILTTAIVYNPDGSELMELYHGRLNNGDSYAHCMSLNIPIRCNSGVYFAIYAQLNAWINLDIVGYLT